MAVRNVSLNPFSHRFLTSFTIFPSVSTSASSPSILPSHRFIRHLHKVAQPVHVPPPTPFVPDLTTFLSLIGRNMVRFAPKFASWDELFTLSSAQMKDRGIEPPRSRRYLLRWRQKFRRGEYGVGGDFDHVVDGVAHLRVIEVARDTTQEKNDNTLTSHDGNDGSQKSDNVPPLTVTGSVTLSPGMKWAVVNLPPGETEPKEIPRPLKRYKAVRLVRGGMLRAPYLKVLKGTNGTAGTIQVQEGMWEDRRGRKIDGGERRQAEVRAKRKSEERKKKAV
ncbi:uncharacterized protein PADG_04002 [Paracoccidioides brasiliensis Pb18]|uniref:Small ribosomal subunit protein mS41 n=1 Tax=Paracoccidioides brasiliensis (strain Pb18) TaxID=502780 RepID=C1G9R6_PARBD|nr:uncharacterized protein PADG_04002 [Paracoccidioides brasiliensis Pb18]EEH47918.1 hypothetical protein PADG_04002 [Paracoccidioides brasiliensis Pb18]